MPYLTKYGIVGIRYWSIANALGTDTKIDEEKMKMGWKISNKIKNAKKFIDMQIQNNWIGQCDMYYTEWILEKEKILKCFEDFEIDNANVD